MNAKTIAVLVLSFVPAIVAACSSEEAAAPSRPPVPPPSTSSSGGTGDDGGSSSGGEGGTTKDCFDTKTAKPSAPKEFLNQCNSGTCFKFDNATRIEGWTPGSPLPSLN